MSDTVRGAPSLEIAVLPRAVQILRARLLQAAASRDVEDLKVPLGWNEVPPLFRRSQPAGFDAIAFLKARSFDGQGREMLAILGNVLRQAFVAETRGPSLAYRWPAFPVVPEMAPAPAERLARWRCTRFADLAVRDAGGRPPIHSVTIGPDGTWHTFWTEV